jgi:hypothetical protein
MLAGAPTQLILSAGTYSGSSSLFGRRRLSGTPIVFGNNSVPSAITFSGDGNTVLSNFPLVVSAGAPPISFSGLRFEDSDSSPALTLEGAEVTIDDCKFSRNHGSALSVQGHSAAATIRRSQFESNGNSDLPRGGAISVLDGGWLHVEESMFASNVAAEGGAISVVGFG